MPHDTDTPEQLLADIEAHYEGMYGDPVHGFLTRITKMIAEDRRDIVRVPVLDEARFKAPSPESASPVE